MLRILRLGDRGPDERDVRRVGDTLMRSIVAVPSEHPDCVVPGGVRASAQ
jgi:hypothetical protein